MDFGLSEPQTLLRDSIASYLKQNVTVERVRSIMESEAGFDRAVYRELAEQGVTSLLIDEEHGGAGLGAMEAGIAGQELGRANTPLNFHTSCVQAPLLIQALGSAEQKSRLLSGIADGSTLVGVINDGPTDGDALNGSVLYVEDAAAADVFVLLTDQGNFLLDPSDSRVTATPLLTIDETRRLGELRFDTIPLAELDRLESDVDATARAEQAAQIALAADTVGACYQAVDIAVEYSKGREQFGRVIASFQAVKHMCAEMIAAADPLQSLLWYTAFQWDEGNADAAWLAPQLKAHVSEAGDEVVTKATQVFGGMGFTWECDMHLSFKRVGYDRQLLGSPEELRHQAAALQL